MNKYDKILMVVILIGSLLLYTPLLISDYQTKDAEKTVVVQYRDEIVLEVPLDEDATYTVDGTLGEVFVEIQDFKVRIEKETSPYHLCSIQGWVGDVNRPIICLPNHIVVRIVAKQESDTDVDSVIQ
ncbi:MAG: NusG domain II-containing protein [Erysipelotrichaceae bacterium]